MCEFYSKGNRRDSSCKRCKKQRVKATYLAKRNSLSRVDMPRFIELAAVLHLKRLRAFESELSDLVQERKVETNVTTKCYAKVA
jgi:hypothetical protein